MDLALRGRDDEQDAVVGALGAQLPGACGVVGDVADPLALQRRATSTVTSWPVRVRYAASFSASAALSAGASRRPGSVTGPSIGGGAVRERGALEPEARHERGEREPDDDERGAQADERATERAAGLRRRPWDRLGLGRRREMTRGLNGLPVALLIAWPRILPSSVL